MFIFGGHLKKDIDFLALRYVLIVHEIAKLSIISIEALCYCIICTDWQVITLIDPAAHLIYIYIALVV